MRKILLLAASHLAVLAIGFALGIYLLPILAAPPPPPSGELAAAAGGARFRTEFRRELKGSDALHWGEGKVTIGDRSVTFEGKMAPGPAYRLYLVPGSVETGEEFLKVTARSRVLGDITTCERFIVPLPAGTRLEDYESVVVWCEAFSMFITAGRYR